MPRHMIKDSEPSIIRLLLSHSMRSALHQGLYQPEAGDYTHPYHTPFRC